MLLACYGALQIVVLLLLLNCARGCFQWVAEQNDS